jgi:flagellin-like hook-associated protein FlgL
MSVVTGLLGRLEADTAALRLRMEVLTRQVSTGRRAEAQGDIAPALPRALSLRAEIGRRETYGTAIGEALNRTQATQKVLERLGTIAREFGDGVAMRLDPNDTASLSLVATRARAALVEVGQLLNSQSAGEYLFGGSDFSRPPVPDPEELPTGGLAAGIAAAIAGLGGGNAAAIIAATRAVAMDDSAGVTPFSGFLSDPASGLAEPRRSAPAGDGQAVPYGLFANRNAAAASMGETTGSWARDLLRGLASLAALTPAQAASPADFRALAGTIRDGLKSASNAIADEAGALGLTEARLSAVRERHAVLTDALKAQLADIEEVDLAATLTRLQATRTALEASYSALGRLGALTLTRYLP